MCCIIMLLMAVIGAVLIPILITKLWEIKEMCRSLGNIKHSNKLISWFCYPTFIFFNLVNYLVHRTVCIYSLSHHHLATKVGDLGFFCNWAMGLPRSTILFIHGLFCSMSFFSFFYLFFVVILLDMEFDLIVFDFIDVVCSLFFKIGL